MSANNKQVGGAHYQHDGEQHWDRIYRLYGRGYFIGCATKYLERYHLKNGKQDLEKAIHFIEKLIELEYPVIAPIVYDPLHAQLELDLSVKRKIFSTLEEAYEGDATSAYVNQDR